MSIPRIFQNATLNENHSLTLDTQASHYLANVMRAKPGDKCIIFNGLGGEYHATVAQLSKKNVLVNLGEFNDREAESPLDLCLAQGISRGEKMDYTIQKA